MHKHAVREGYTLWSARLAVTMLAARLHSSSTRRVQSNSGLTHIGIYNLQCSIAEITQESKWPFHPQSWLLHSIVGSGHAFRKTLSLPHNLSPGLDAPSPDLGVAGCSQ